MLKKTISYLLIFVAFFGMIKAQNPLITDEFTADPSARVFNGKVYVYPSHDIRKDSGRFATWFCMEDYHVYSSENLTQWKDHGVILSQYDVPWVDNSTYSMWAPDCIEKDGKYYFYFPSTAKDKTQARGRRVGVAIADSPEGPFVPQDQPMEKVYGIDPNPFIDTDGQAYLYWGGGEKLYMAKLKDNMLELATEPQVVTELPPKFKEGPYLFEREGKYYFTFPHVPETTEQLVYAMGDNPMGPFEYKGVIMEESPVGCWTNHHSIIEYQNQWFLFYHHNDLSPDFDKNRSIKADSLFFNEDGTIQKVTPSLRGVGISPADSKIQIDRYSEVSTKGTSTQFVDKSNPKKGWEIVLKKPGAWVRYDKVDFKNDSLEKTKLKAMVKGKGRIEVRTNNIDGELLAVLDFSGDGEWQVVEDNLKKYKKGVYDLVLISKGETEVAIDWVQFD